MKINFKKNLKSAAPYIKKTTLWAAKKIPPTTKGFINAGYNGTVNLGNRFIGDWRIRKLEDKLHEQSITFNNEIKKYKSQYPYFDYYVVSGFSIPSMIQNRLTDPDLELAYQYQFPSKANEIRLTEAWQSFDSPEEILGFNNALKGKLFEVKYLDHISKTLEPGYTAKLADSPTQKGFDIEIYNSYGQIDQQLQLKASTSASYIKDALNQYPEIDVVTLEDLDGQMLLANYSDRIISSKISHDDLLSSMGSSVESSLDYLPLLGISLVAFSAYTQKEASEFQKTVKFVERITDYAVNAAILASTGFIGIPIVFLKQHLLKSGEKKRQYIEQLKEKLSRQKQSHKRMKKMFSRRDFLKSLVIAPVGLKTSKI